jgi:hypothetical protein
MNEGSLINGHSEASAVKRFYQSLGIIERNLEGNRGKSEAFKKEN